MPSLPERRSLPFPNPLNAAHFHPAKVAAALQLYGSQPKLGKAVVPLYMYMERLVSIT